MVTSTIKKDIVNVDYTVPNDTSAHLIQYPNGWNQNSITMLAAKYRTKYDTWVDSNYDAGAYFGYIRFLINGIEFTPYTAGNTTRIIFTFARV